MAGCPNVECASGNCGHAIRRSWRPVNGASGSIAKLCERELPEPMREWRKGKSCHSAPPLTART